MPTDESLCFEVPIPGPAGGAETHRFSTRRPGRGTEIFTGSPGGDETRVRAGEETRIVDETDERGEIGDAEREIAFQLQRGAVVDAVAAELDIAVQAYRRKHSDLSYEQALNAVEAAAR